MELHTLLIRADASVGIGTGHVMRCLALAQAWQDAGGSAIFAMAEGSHTLRSRLARESIAIFEIDAPPGSTEDASATAALARQHPIAWVAVDGYQFSADYQHALKNAGFKILFLDDYGHASHYCADLVLNQNISATTSLYRHREPYTRLLLGTQYSLLRREFTSRQQWKREIAPAGHRVLITMGGSDPENITEKALAAVQSIDDEIEAVVVIGGSNLHRTGSQTLSTAGKRMTFLHDVSNMAEPMAWADVAISAAGTTGWELCFMGLPSLLIDVAENQTTLARELDRRGCGIYLGSGPVVSSEMLANQLKRLLNSFDLRARMSLRAREIVDGKGAGRVVSALRGYLLHLRPARESDGRLLWNWANDEPVRSASFCSAPIPWETHLEWFTKKLQQEGCHIWIAEDAEDKPVGQVRFDRRPNGEYEIALSLDAKYRGLGLAAALIEQSLQTFSDSRNMPIHAFVKPDNAASLKAFAKGGFERVESEIVHGQPAVHLIRDAAKSGENPAIDDVVWKERTG